MRLWTFLGLVTPITPCHTRCTPHTQHTCCFTALTWSFAGWLELSNCNPLWPSTSQGLVLIVSLHFLQQAGRKPKSSRLSVRKGFSKGTLLLFHLKARMTATESLPGDAAPSADGGRAGSSTANRQASESRWMWDSSSLLSQPARQETGGAGGRVLVRPRDVSAAGCKNNGRTLHSGTRRTTCSTHPDPN
jgi:hypothetical protein